VLGRENTHIDKQHTKGRNIMKIPAIALAFMGLCSIITVPAWLFLGLINNAILPGAIFAFAFILIAWWFFIAAEHRMVEEAIGQRHYKGNLI
jgi:hypothetical protein